MMRPRSAGRIIDKGHWRRARENRGIPNLWAAPMKEKEKGDAKIGKRVFSQQAPGLQNCMAMFEGRKPLGGTADLRGGVRRSTTPCCVVRSKKKKKESSKVTGTGFTTAARQIAKKEKRSSRQEDGVRKKRSEGGRACRCGGSLAGCRHPGRQGNNRAQNFGKLKKVTRVMVFPSRILWTLMGGQRRWALPKPRLGKTLLELASTVLSRRMHCKKEKVCKGDSGTDLSRR